MTLSGTVTATDRNDFNQILISFQKDDGTAATDKDIFETITGNKFTVKVKFTAAEKDVYRMAVYLFWPGAPAQFPRSNVGPILVD